MELLRRSKDRNLRASAEYVNLMDPGYVPGFREWGRDVVQDSQNDYNVGDNRNE